MLPWLASGPLPLPSELGLLEETAAASGFFDTSSVWCVRYLRYPRYPRYYLLPVAGLVRRHPRPLAPRLLYGPVDPAVHCDLSILRKSIDSVFII